ncbi:MAG: FecR domain-containing protein, partial [Chromatiales bacterium]
MTFALQFGKFAARFAIVWFCYGLTQTLSASECEKHAAKALSIQGQVEMRSDGESAWIPVHQNMDLCPGDRLRVGEKSRAGLMLSNDTLLRLAEHSNIRISAPAQEGSAWLELMRGIAHFISRVRHTFQVDTPYVNASVEGTEFTVQTSEDGSDVTVLEGRVLAANPQGEILVNGGERARVLPGKAPEAEAVVDPLDAVQWALYYPPVIEALPERPSAELRRSYEAYVRGDIEGAFAALAQSGDVEQEAALLVYRASLHLQVGATEAARRDLAAALRLQPEHPNGLALMSIISTVRNERQQAIELAQRAVAADPQAGSPLLALSYARQALFQLPEALEAAKKATQVAPESHLAWSRLAQLQLMFRRLDQALEAAGRAVEIAPDQPQALTTQGFAQLIRFDLDGARQRFEQAAALDQADPLPRLGLGLVEIRQGDLQTGRRQLETAASMDPGYALIRSYLGKAYYEEKRNEHAATQFALAKQFDERDPTAWFYDAILKQSENRPIEALRELQTSIDLNDNRAVYRSRLLLDQDEAARNASQARIYQDLGFEQLARAEAYKSLQTDAASHSAHRL